ncbi:hypothetical protein OB955_07680 [Halobacteria archaeon AArc-m2/3/4]|uniref:CARDB protein n=1 Tax=Natronoglomus mannanivorans TaxID=2979990 RepID=A0ABT2QCG7_9EURY|nr:hypothetical protein [Halobacteria archaeon AArc-m2/3/4]
MHRRRYLIGIGMGIGVLASADGRAGTTTRNETDLSLWVLETNAPVDAGTVLEVTARLDNAGSTAVSRDVSLVVGDDRLDTASVTVDGGETETVTLGYETYPVERNVRFPVTVESGALVDERTVGVFGTDDSTFDYVSPADEISVQPGTTVLFEVDSVALGEYGGETSWSLDGDHLGRSFGPWYAEYYATAGADYWQHTFELSGTYEVTAAVAEGYTTNWTVHVDPEGNAAPTVDDARPSPGTLTLTDDETADLEIDVGDSDAGLDRVVWWLGHADVVLDVTDVDGTTATASTTIDSSCHGCPIIAWVIDEEGAVASEHLWTIDAIGEPTLDVSILETNDPVAAGEFLEVTVELENAGDTETTQEVSLTAGDEQVDATTVTVAVGETTRLTLGYETYPVQQDVEFPVTVATDDDAAHRTVTVLADADPSLDVTILDANDPVSAGGVLEVTARVENTGAVTATQTVRLVAGDDQVASESVSVAPGETTRLTLGYETYPVQQDVEFPVTVATDDDADDRVVTVYGAGDSTLDVTILETNEPVAAGEFLEVTARLENTGSVDATQTVVLVVGDEHVDTLSVTVPGETATTVTLGYETDPVERDVEFPVTVASEDDADERTVSVSGTG